MCVIVVAGSTLGPMTCFNTYMLVCLSAAAGPTFGLTVQLCNVLKLHSGL
jgi:hypothetical protein